MSSEFALSRTTRLINRVFFEGEARDHMIVNGLNATTIRLVGDAQNLSSRGGQAALVTAFQLVVRMGIAVELIVPDVALVAVVPPLRESTLLSALIELGKDLVPGAAVRSEPGDADVTFVFGDSLHDDPGAIYVAVHDFGCRLEQDPASREAIGADFPIGGLAAGAAVAAVALEAALPHVERAAGVTCSDRPRPSAGPPVEIDLLGLFPALRSTAVDMGRLDVISGGAITNAFIYALLWFHGITAQIRVIEKESADLSNLNRYLLLRASEVDHSKIDSLSAASSGSLRIGGIREHFTKESRSKILPLAERVAVGVDDIQARWWVQEEWPARLYVGATNNHEAVVTNHRPGSPCAGCAHSDLLPPSHDDFIPTISFVSFWAGLLQVCALLSEADGQGAARRVTVFPFGLGGTAWCNEAELRVGDRCPVGCADSLAA